MFDSLFEISQKLLDQGPRHLLWDLVLCSRWLVIQCSPWLGPYNYPSYMGTSFQLIISLIAIFARRHEALAKEHFSKCGFHRNWVVTPTCNSKPIFGDFANSEHKEINRIVPTVDGVAFGG